MVIHSTTLRLQNRVMAVTSKRGGQPSWLAPRPVGVGWISGMLSFECWNQEGPRKTRMPWSHRLEASSRGLQKMLEKGLRNGSFNYILKSPFASPSLVFYLGQLSGHLLTRFAHD